MYFGFWGSLWVSVEAQGFSCLWQRATQGAGPISFGSCGNSVHSELPTIILGSPLIINILYMTTYRERRLFSSETLASLRKTWWPECQSECLSHVPASCHVIVPKVIQSFGKRIQVI